MKRLLPILGLTFGFIACSPCWCAVAHDAHTSDTLITTGTTGASPSLTASASSTCVIGIFSGVGSASAPTSITATWNSVAMTAGPVKTTGLEVVAIYYKTLPATGAHTVSFSWANSVSEGYVAAISFTGTDTTSCVKAVDNITAATSPISVTSDASGATVAAAASTTGGLIVTNQTQIYTDSFNGDSAASYALGGTTNSHTFSNLSGSIALAGVHVQPPSGSVACVNSIAMIGLGCR